MDATSGSKLRMRRFSVRLTPSQADDIAVVCELGPAGILAAKRRVDAGSPTIRQTSASDLLAADLPANVGPSLTNVVFGLSSLWSRDPGKISEVLSEITKAILREYSKDSRFSNWDECVPALEELFRSDSIFLSAKAADISYDFERVLTASRVLTSLRPVYDPNRTNIVGVTVVQTLRLEFISSDGRPSNLSFALDIDDLTELRDACEDGLTKLRLAKETAKNKWSLEAIVVGDDKA